MKPEDDKYDEHAEKLLKQVFPQEQKKPAIKIPRHIAAFWLNRRLWLEGKPKEQDNFWTFMAGWTESRDFLPDEAIGMLQDGRGSNDEIRESAVLLFWYSFYHNWQPDDMLNRLKYQIAVEDNRDPDGPMAVMHQYDFAVLSTLIEFRDRFDLDSIRVPAGPHKLSVRSLAMLMATAAKVVLMPRPLRFDQDLIAALKTSCAAIQNGDITELEHFSNVRKKEQDTLLQQYEESWGKTKIVVFQDSSELVFDSDENFLNWQKTHDPALIEQVRPRLSAPHSNKSQTGFKLNVHTPLSDLLELSACVAVGIVCNSYAHYKAEQGEFLTAFLANVTAAEHLQSAAEAIDQYHDWDGELPCNEDGWNVAEYAKTKEWWDKAKGDPSEVASWDDVSSAIEKLRSTACSLQQTDDWEEEESLWRDELPYFEAQIEFCHTMKTSRPPLAEFSTTIRPGEPFTNISKLRKILRIGEEYIWWADPHFRREGLELLSSADIRGVKRVHILSGSANFTEDPTKPGKGRAEFEHTRSDFQRFRKELARESIEAEWRVLDFFSHDRFILSAQRCYNVPPIRTLLQGSYSEIRQTPDRPPFSEWWRKATPLENWMPKRAKGPHTS